MAEIARDPALRLFGAALAAVNALTAYFWLETQPIGAILSPSTVPTVCWPFLESCHTWRFLDKSFITLLVAALLGFSLHNVAQFIRRQVAAGYWLLLALSCLKYILILQDYRLVLNQHYMALWAVGVFLFVPAKREALSWLLILFYLWAGVLKLNDEWLSGAALYGRRPFGMPESWIPFACVYVLVLELVFAPLLKARSYLHHVAFIQLVIFHLSSWWVVGFFYPLLMALLLSIFPLSRKFPITQAVGAGRGGWPGGLHTATWAVIGVFCALQVVPRTFSDDPALTGEGRMFALNMFDAPTTCVASLDIRQDGAVVRQERLAPPFLQARIVCDPIVYFEASRHLCALRPSQGRPVDFDLVLKSRRYGKTDFVDVINIPSFCAANLSYTVLWPNSWIIKP